MAEDQGRKGRGVTLRWVAGAIALVVLVGVGVVLASRRGRGDLARSGDTAPASRQDFEIVTTASGELEAKNRVELRSGLERQSLITFIVHELEADHPVVDLRVFANRSYAAGTGLNFLTGFALFSGSYLFSLFCGAVLRQSALDTGEVFLAAGSVSVIMMPLVGRMAPKVDGRYLLFIGVAVVVASQIVASHLTGDVSFWDQVKPNMIRSFGLGFVFIPVSVLALSDISPEKRGNATGLFNLTRELGGSIGTAVMGMLVTDGIKERSSYLAEHVSSYDSVAQDQQAMLRAGVGSQTYTPDGVAERILQLKVTKQAMILSFEDGFRIVAAAMALGIVLVLLLRKPKAGVEVQGAH